GAGGLPIGRRAREGTSARLHRRRLDVHPGRFPESRGAESGPTDHAADLPPAVRVAWAARRSGVPTALVSSAGPVLPTVAGACTGGSAAPTGTARRTGTAPSFARSS